MSSIGSIHGGSSHVHAMQHAAAAAAKAEEQAETPAQKAAERAATTRPGSVDVRA
jgi:hypothetical protein